MKKGKTKEGIVIEKNGLDNLIPELHGHVVVELIDDSGAVVQREEGDNFIALGAYEWIKRAIRGLITGWTPNNCADYMEFTITASNYNAGIFRYMLLLDDTSAEDPTNEQNWKGNIIGYGSQNFYTGSDLKGGTVYPLFCHADSRHLQFCWEFANDRANGTFRSIALVKGMADADKYKLYLPETQMAVNGLLPRNYASGLLCDGGGFFWGSIGSNLLWKIDKTTLQEIAQYTLPDSPSAYFRLFYDNGFIYYMSISNYLKRYEIATGITTTGPVCPYSYTYMYGVDIIDGYIYGVISSNNRVFRVPLNLGAFETKAVTAHLDYGYNVHISKDGQIRLLCIVPGVEGGQWRWFTLDWAAGTLALSTDIPWGPEVFGNGMGYAFKLANGEWAMMGAANGTYVPTGHSILTTVRKIINLTEKGAGSLMTRKLLTNPVTKTSAYKMRIIYRIDFTT